MPSNAPNAKAAADPVVALFKPPLAAGQVRDPVCGMAVDPAKTSHKAEHGGTTYRFCCDGCRTKFVADPERFLASKTEPPVLKTDILDPVCGMRVDPATAKYKTQRDGKTYSFCSGGCREKFITDPARYLAPTSVAASAPKTAVAGAIYTCPMHPQIRQVGPGACPICGMALEPVAATAEVGENPELMDMTRRFWVALALALPVFVPGLFSSRYFDGRRAIPMGVNV